MDASHFYFDCNMEDAVLLPFAHGTACVLSRRCPQRTSANEDAAAVVGLDETAGVLMVADGVGGLAQGEQAARGALEEVTAAISRAMPGESAVRTAILDGIEAANVRIQQQLARGATTLAIVELSSGHARPYHVGDSTILLVGGRGKLKLQTVSHSPVGYGVESGLLDEQEAMFHADRHLVSNFVGSPAMRIEIGPLLRFSVRDTLLIASDGLIDNLHTEEIVTHLRTGKLPEIARRLADHAQQRMAAAGADMPSKPDDVTLILYRPS